MTNLQQPPADAVGIVANEMRAVANLLATAGSDSDPFDGRALDGLCSLMGGWVERLEAAAEPMQARADSALGRADHAAAA